MQFVTFAVFVLLFSGVIAASTVPPDPCVAWVDLPQTSERATSTNGPPLICDTLLATAWYRVRMDKTDVDIATDCPGQPDRFMCSALFQVWMVGSIPTAQLGVVDRTVLTTDENCTVKSQMTISVKNCGNYRVYRLKKTSTCPTAYCFDLPTTKSPPILLNPSVVVFEDHLATNVQIGFRCELDQPVPPTHLVDIIWTIDDIFVTSFQGLTCNNLESGNLKHYVWDETHKMGFLVKCSVRVYESGSPSNVAPQISPPFFAGIEVTPQELSVLEGEKKHVSIKSTVPVGYIPSLQNNTFLNLFIHYDDDEEHKCTNGIQQKDIVLERQNCGVTIPASDWMTPVTLEITGYVDGLYNKDDRLKSIRLVSPPNFIHKAWDSVRVPDIKVKVVDQDVQLKSKICRSCNDPHMTTFDGKRWENQRSGEYVMYKHKHFPLQINAAYLPCSVGSPTPTCNCGVAIRSYNSLFVVNLCGGHTFSAGGFSDYVATRNCDDTTLVTKGSNPYTITLPTGTTVNFHIGGSTIECISIYPSPVDVQNTEGLCGLLNNDNSDDIALRNGTTASDTKQFALDWKIANGSADSLFNSNVALVSPQESLRTYCDCATDSTNPFNLTNQVHCNLTAATALCSSNQNGQLNGIVSTCEQYSGSDLDIMGRSFTYEDTDESQNVALRWTNGWTEQTARDHCNAVFNNASFNQLCIDLAQHEPGLFIDNCVEDIKLTGDGSWAETELEAFRVECLMETEKNETLLVTTVLEDNSTSLKMLILKNICLNDCSKNGICKDGKCTCFHGFAGSDCSVSMFSPLNNVRIPDKGLCDLHTRPCMETVVAADNIPEDSSITCSFRYFGVFPQLTIFQNVYTEAPATFLFPGAVKCPLPNGAPYNSLGHGFRIRLARKQFDVFSEETEMFIYDSTRVSCDRATYLCNDLNP